MDHRNHELVASENFIYDNVIMCKMDPLNTHILKEPKVLPCGNTACLTCIENALDESKQLSCKFTDCSEVHYLRNPTDLPVNVIAENAFRDNRRTIIEFLINKLQNTVFELKGAFDERKIGNVFEFNEMKIISRIDTLKLELDKLKDDLIKIMRAYRVQFVEAFDRSFELREQNYRKFITRVHETLQSTRTSDDALKKNMYLCQEYITELRHYSGDKLKDVLFKPSDFVPNIDCVGEILGCKVSTILTNKLRILNLKMESCNGICYINEDRLVLTSFDENKVLIADKIFDLNTCIVKEIGNIKHHTFNGPFGVCTDRFGNLFICDSLHDRIIATDVDLTKVRYVFGKNGSALGEFDGPCDVCFFDNSLYVLDTGNKRIQEFSITGEIRRELKLYKRGIEQFDNTFKRELLTNPVRFEIIQDIIAVVDNFADLYTYSFNGRVMQVIKNTRDMCFLETYLFTCSPDGILHCYEKTRVDNTKYYYAQLYKRYIEILKTPLSFMKYFEGHLVFSLSGNKRNLAIL